MVRFSQLLENTYLEIEVVMVIVNNFFELFSIPKMVDMYFSTYYRDTLQAWWVVRHNGSISQYSFILVLSKKILGMRI